MQSLAAYVKDVAAGNVSVVEQAHLILEQAKRIDSAYNYLNTFADERFLQEAETVDKSGKKGLLAGVAVSVKDCICVKGVESTGGSAILRGYKPLFDATAVARASAAHGLILGKTSQDEFGFGSSNTNVGNGFKVPKHPVDTSHVCGGSSGGAAGLTRKASFPHVALAESTGGSITCPAAYCGVVGFCPTYGRVSRWGLIDYANSLDKIGTMAGTVEDAALLLELIAGHDPNDSTSAQQDVPHWCDDATDVKGLRIGVVTEGFGEGVDTKVADSVKRALKDLEVKGATLQDASLPNVAKYGISSYYIMAMCEASTNLAKYCGMRYGAHEKLEGDFNSYFTAVRTKHFGDETKRRLMLGTFARMAGYRDAYYLKALRVRTMLIKEYKQAFKDVDVLVTPTMPAVAPTFEEIKSLSPLQEYMADILTVGPNLAGLPHLSVPVQPVDGLPAGMQFVADHFNEAALVRAGRGAE